MDGLAVWHDGRTEFLPGRGNGASLILRRDHLDIEFQAVAYTVHPRTKKPTVRIWVPKVALPESFG